jgi:hypothetical protein
MEKKTAETCPNMTVSADVRNSDGKRAAETNVLLDRWNGA